MTKEWTADDVLAVARRFQAACVLTAAADLDLFSVLASGQPATSAEVAKRIAGDLHGKAAESAGESADLPGASLNIRGVTILLDALVALELLDKQEGQYILSPGTGRLLVDGHPESVLPMVRHQGNCLRRWAQLAAVIRDGKPASRRPSIRGENADNAAFIGAMDNICAPIADALIAELQPLEFHHLLDVGGASGTWTLAFLRERPDAQATLFDLEHVLPMADQRITEAGLRDRVRLVGGDFLADPLPAGADLAWISAIVHQNSRAENRRLFAAVAAALPDGGRVLIRDILMDASRTVPPGGALFAINMLVATEGGGTFTFDELREDLEAAGFQHAEVLRRDDWMNSIVRATKG
jgi:hypothetical protein